MTTTTIYPEGQRAPLPAPTLPAPLPAAPAPRPSPHPVSTAASDALPAQLLSSAGDHTGGNVLRLGLGFLGLSALALLPDASRLLVEPGRSELSFVDWGLVFTLDAISLPVAAVLTLTFALPGLLILLAVFDQPLVPSALFQGVARAYYRVGLLALGATPTLVLFALTGAAQGLVGVGVTLTYLGAGVLSLAVLLRDLLGSLEHRRGLAPLVLLGWACFVGLFGLHLFTRLNVQPWI